MRVCTSWWSKFDSWQFDFICDNPNQESLTLWQWWNHCLSMIRSGLIAPGVLHLDSIINYHVMRRQTPHLKTVAAPSDSSWWFRSSMEVGDTDHIRWRCQFFKFFSRMDFEPWKTVTVTRWRASSLTHILQSNKAQPELFHLPCGPSPFWLEGCSPSSWYFGWQIGMYCSSRHHVYGRWQTIFDS